MLQYNRKGKYGVIGGSGTNCLEVINLHNRYITCSYPTTGTILAVTSHQERIAFGGTSSAFNIVSFYDPKYEKDKYNIGIEDDFDYRRPSQGVITLFHDDESVFSSTQPSETVPGTPVTVVDDGSKADHDNKKQDAVKPDDKKPRDEKPSEKKTSRCETPR